MNTQRSDKLAKQYLESGKCRSRKVQTYTRRFDASAADMFFQLCPARECDWIPGWDCDLVYTTSGYVEPDCIFTTAETNSVGPGLWIFTRYEPDAELGLVRIIGSKLVIHLRISVEDHGDGTCTGKWHVTYTGLDDAGDELVKSLPAQNPEMVRAIDGLEYYLRHGELMPVC